MRSENPSLNVMAYGEAMKNLRALRLERALSIDALAENAGVSNKTVVEIEAGRVRPKMRTVRRLSNALRVAPQQVQEFAVVLGLTDPSSQRVHLVSIQARCQPNGAIASLSMSVHEPNTDLLCVRLVSIALAPTGPRIESNLGGTHRVVPIDPPGAADARPLLILVETVMEHVRDRGTEHDETRRFAEAFIWRLSEYLGANKATP